MLTEQIIAVTPSAGRDHNLVSDGKVKPNFKRMIGKCGEAKAIAFRPKELTCSDSHATWERRGDDRQTVVFSAFNKQLAQWGPLPLDNFCWQICSRPETLHEIVEYTPSLIEWKVTAGIGAFGLLLLTVMLKLIVTVFAGRLTHEVQ